MRSKDFVEIEEEKFVKQLGSFWSALTTYGASVGFTSAEIDEVEKDYRWMEYAVHRSDQVQAYAQGFTAFKKDLRHGANKPMPESTLAASSTLPPPTPVNGNIEKRFRRRARRIKSHPNYSDVMGEQLRIVAPRQEFDEQKAIPQFKIEMKGNHPVIKFKKKHFEAFDIYKNDGSGFKKLERVSRSPYVDEGELPPSGQTAAWKYKLIGVINDKPVGGFSPEVVTVVYR